MSDYKHLRMLSFPLVPSCLMSTLFTVLTMAIMGVHCTDEENCGLWMSNFAFLPAFPGMLPGMLRPLTLESVILLDTILS